jgi:uncharacterized RDD family membrane protein YckC
MRGPRVRADTDLGGKGLPPLPYTSHPERPVSFIPEENLVFQREVQWIDPLVRTPNPSYSDLAIVVRLTLRLRTASFWPMFTIIGGDGKEYGPATVEQLRAWITAGRANLDTQAKAAGSDEWRRLGDFAEFSSSAPQSLPPPIAPSSAARLASRWLRLGAWFIDNLFVFVCCLPGLLVVGFSVIFTLLTDRANAQEAMSPQNMLGWLLIAVGGFVVFVVQVWMLSTRGQTIGKRLLGVRIVGHVDEANPGFLRAVALRAVVPGLIGMIPGVGFIFSLVDVCFIFREDRRCVHDFIAQTKVIEVATTTA